MLRSIVSSVLTFAAVTQALSLNVASSGGNASSALQYGLMFEDINHSGDGGIYAELIQNRAFQGTPASLNAWGPIGNAKLTLDTLAQPLSSALPTSVNVAGSGDRQVGIQNSGYWGIDVKKQPYAGSFWVKGSYSGDFTASLVSNTSGQVLGSATIRSAAAYGNYNSNSNGWIQHNYTLIPHTNGPNSNNTFQLTFNPSKAASGSLDFNLISLFPPTYKNTPNGNRQDLMQALAGLNPSFFRIPGGNNLEGNAPNTSFWMWNETIGPLQNRPGYAGTWGYENTLGLGLIEYLRWARDLGMEPILALWDGEWLDGTILTEAQLQPYIQYALDELEFLMGDASTTYGAQRIALGYPTFQINYVEIGNEDNLNGGLPTYQEYRFNDFYNAVKKAYPNITVIASTQNLTLPGDAASDYHDYNRPNNLVAQFNYFDQNNASHKTLVGELANIDTNLANNPPVDFNVSRLLFPNWIGSVSEAVFFLGLERNSEAMIGVAYAPLLQNLNSYEWTPDLISFTADPAQTILSTSYYVIQLFSATRLTNTLPIANATYGPAYYVAGTTADGGRAVKAAVYNSTGDFPLAVTLDGVAQGTKATLTVLTGQSGNAENTPNATNVVKTTTTTLTAGANGLFEYSLPDLSVSVLKVDGASKGYRHRMARDVGE